MVKILGVIKNDGKGKKSQKNNFDRKYIYNYVNNNNLFYVD